MKTLLIQFGAGIALSGLISAVAYRRGSLSRSGVAGAMIVGTLIFGFGGWVWGMLLITFFVSSSLLSHYREFDKRTLAEKFAKGHRRDLWQALANAAAGSLIAVLSLAVQGPLALAAFVGAMATVNADTWATELGVLSKRPPRLITNWKPVEYGTSGGVSALGTLATLGGGLLIGLAALIFLALDELAGGRGFVAAATGSEGFFGGLAGSLWLLPVAGAGGLAGSLFDSLLGATVQAIYYSSSRQKETEKKIDPDGTPNTLVRGWRWLDNDLVNFLSSLVGAAVAALVWGVIAR